MRTRVNFNADKLGDWLKVPPLQFRRNKKFILETTSQGAWNEITFAWNFEYMFKKDVSFNNIYERT